MARNAAHTTRWNGVPSTSTGMLSSASSSPSKYAARRSLAPAGSGARLAWNRPKRRSRSRVSASRRSRRSANSRPHNLSSRAYSATGPMGVFTSSVSRIITVSFPRVFRPHRHDGVRAPRAPALGSRSDLPERRQPPAGSERTPHAEVAGGERVGLAERAHGHVMGRPFADAREGREPRNALYES